jgi:ribosomal protein L44E
MSRQDDDNQGFDEPEFRESEGPTYNLEKTLNAPRKKHGTRVVMNFVCSGCGLESSLDYKPKGVPLNEILCEACMKAQGKVRWEMVREKKEMETKKRSWMMTCTECGRQEESSKPPRRGKPYICRRCFREEASPDHSRLEGVEEIEDAEVPTFIRRKKVEEED